MVCRLPSNGLLLRTLSMRNWVVPLPGCPTPDGLSRGLLMIPDSTNLAWAAAMRTVTVVCGLPEQKIHAGAALTRINRKERQSKMIREDRDMNISLRSRDGERLLST